MPKVYAENAKLRIENEQLRPWRATVRDIYDECHLGPNNAFTGERLARRLIDMIEQRHPQFFGAAATKETP